jgi:2-polyprenyl-3-methyl-5-hydroxy-6-metoxy-1,4-benzoquinol methylase
MTEHAYPVQFDPVRYWEQRLEARYTLGSTGWLSLGERFNQWSYAVRRPAFTRLARAALEGKTTPRVLDVGSGTGFYLDVWQRLGVRELAGSDLTSAAVERLKLAFPQVAVRRVDIGAADVALPAGAYDVISIMDVLYHLVDDDRYARALYNLARLLKPDGTLILSENFATEEQRGEHQVSRTREQIEHSLSTAKLQIVSVQPVFFLMNTPMSSSSQMLRRWWNLASRLAMRNEAFGWCIGAAAFPVEIALGRLLRDGPSTKMVLCRRA